MVSTLSVIVSIMAKTAFFFPSVILGESQDDHDRRTEDFLNNDGFANETLNDSGNSHYLKVLNRYKEDYRKNYYDQVQQLSERLLVNNFNELDRIFRYNRIQIMRFRLVIEPNTIISINKTHNREQKYSVMRAYWIDDSGKKILKLNVNLGNTEKVMFKNGEYDRNVIRSAEKDIKLKLKALYEETYGIIS